MLFVNFSSVFNSTILLHLTTKQGVFPEHTIAQWILDYLLNVKGNNISSTICQSTGSSRGCVLDPLLFTLMTHDCCVKMTPYHITKHVMVIEFRKKQNTPIYIRTAVEMVKNIKLPGVKAEENLSLSLDTTSLDICTAALQDSELFLPNSHHAVKRTTIIKTLTLWPLLKPIIVVCIYVLVFI